MDRERIKALIELSSSVEEADNVLENQGYKSIETKYAFLSGMFDFTLIGRFDAEDVSEQKAREMDYYAALSAIINNKWEA